jgi:hypothetical protein
VCSLFSGFSVSRTDSGSLGRARWPTWCTRGNVRNKGSRNPTSTLQFAQSRDEFVTSFEGTRELGKLIKGTNRRMICACRQQPDYQLHDTPFSVRPSCWESLQEYSHTRAELSHLPFNSKRCSKNRYEMCLHGLCGDTRPFDCERRYCPVRSNIEAGESYHSLNARNDAAHYSQAPNGWLVLFGGN